ncbi:hypothetical protein V6N11_010469 [Hibiscus sabdariffa]|uniref:Nucleotide-diphospho-sugar transferase domain-containing protein n=1 Tax=Hibiscus sabdariffa TaxID=183260 RepID=A0ABR2S5C4_9ROSI
MFLVLSCNLQKQSKSHNKVVFVQDSTLELEEILKNASTVNKTVILTTLNDAWANPGSIVDLFLKSFKLGDGTHKLLEKLIACNNFLGRSDDMNNLPNWRFKYVKSNERTIAFYKFWYSSREAYPEYHNQDVLNKIKYDPIISNIGLKIRKLIDLEIMLQDWRAFVLLPTDLKNQSIISWRVPRNYSLDFVRHANTPEAGNN